MVRKKKGWVDATPKSTNRGKAPMTGGQAPGLPMRDDSVPETPLHANKRYSTMPLGAGPGPRTSGSGFGGYAPNSSISSKSRSFHSKEESQSEYASEIDDETGSLFAGSDNDDDDFDDDDDADDEEGNDRFDDEQGSVTSNMIEFTGMEKLQMDERLKQAAAQVAVAPESPPYRPSGPVEGDDLLKTYMGVLHGGNGRGDDVSLDGMENKIAKGLSSHGRNDFILNSSPLMQSSSDMSVGSRSNRQSRREAVMVAKRLNFLHDDPAEMTYTRQIALYLMKRYKWYNPRLGEPIDDLEHCESSQMGGAFRTADGYPMKTVKPENPSLENAWAYFEHFTLTRYVYEPKPLTQKSRWERITRKFQKGDKELERAERNENILPTKLYDPIWTPHNQLGDWGVGWGLYFASVRGTMVLCFVAGLCSIPNMIFFASPAYSVGQETVTNTMLLASAICTDTPWVPCPRCAGVSERDLPYDRIALVESAVLGLNLTFAKMNNCNGATTQTGMVHFGVLCLVLIGLFILNRYLMKMEAIYDSDEQSAQHYTIVIKNPPDDATDPEEWRNFFMQNLGVVHVVAVTVAVDNDDLVKKLVERRENLKMMELLLEPGTVIEMNNLAGIAAKVDRTRGAMESFISIFIPGIPELFRRIVILTIDIRGLAQHDYPCKKVFVTFETEADQRRVVQEMAVGKFYIVSKDKSVVKDPKYLFRGEHMLYVHEPLEQPNSYRWISMNERFLDRLWQQTLTSIATIASICLVAFIVRIVHDRSNVMSALAISLFNGAFPEFAKILVKFEGHSTEAAVQTSMYIKICLFRWVNAAVVITIITPFASTLYPDAGGLVTQVYALFFTEIFTMNVIQLADPYGHFMRHFLAPRAKTQDEMNLQMKGLEVELAERYTNMTKILFLALWYSSIYPFGLFMAAFALFINYFTDRHSLMRTWKRAPPLGPGISEFSRRYFVTLSFVAMAFMSSYFWASFPMDNLCSNDKPAPPVFWGQHTITTRNNPPQQYNVTVDPTDFSYRYCNQDLFRSGGRSFPFLPSQQPPGDEWMTEEQVLVTTVYGWAAVGAIILAVGMFVQGWIEQGSKFVWGESSNVSEDRRINFSDVTNISAYIPQVPSDVFSYPLFVCNMDGIGEEVIDWRDPRRPHAFYDLTKDAEKILEGIDVGDRVIFSQMKHWPPQLNNSVNLEDSLLDRGVTDDEDLSDSDADSFDFDLGKTDFLKQVKSWKAGKTF